jgi:hypothetical protein
MNITTTEIRNNFNKTLAVWEQALTQYTPQQLAQKPADNGWSIGQVYQHLVMGALNFQLKQIEKCISSDEGKNEVKTQPGTDITAAGSFPPIQIKVPESAQPAPAQPESSLVIRENIELLRKRFAELSAQIDEAPFHGKTKHPALGFLDAKEWLWILEMHFRHHLHQKGRLDKMLGVQVSVL